MLFDCFLYSVERELLEIQLSEFSHLDVLHIAVQANRTFTNKQKEFEDLDYDRLVSVNVTDMPDGNDPWEREKFQRNSIMRGLESANPKDSDLCIIRDADEIVSADAAEKYKPEMEVAALVMDKMAYWLNCIEGKQSWKIAKILTYELLKKSTPDLIRNSGQQSFIENGGWHFSWLGDVNKVIEKFNSFSHQELNIDKWTNPAKLKQKIETGQSLWGEDFWEIVSVDKSFPSEIYNHLGKYQHLIKW